MAMVLALVGLALTLATMAINLTLATMTTNLILATMTAILILAIEIEACSGYDYMLQHQKSYYHKFLMHHFNLKNL